MPVIMGEPVNGRPQYQYMDVGINIDTQARQDEAGLSVDVTAELSSIAASREQERLHCLRWLGSKKWEERYQ